MMGDTERLILEMIHFFSGDIKRIQHFMKVYAFSETIGKLEKLDKDTYFTLCAAAIVHDAGIKIAEEKYGAGNCGGKLQEELGPAPAQEMLIKAGFDEKTTERVCFLVAHHHTYKGVDGIDWQILLEADFIVNACEDGLSRTAVENAKKSFFRTESGIKLLDEIFGHY